MTDSLRQLCLPLALALLVGSSAALVTAEPAKAVSTITTRVQRLEQKTNYFNTKNRKVTRRYTRPALAPQDCKETIPISFNPSIITGGTAYAWLAATIQYSGDPANIAVNWGPSNFGFPCGKAATTPAGAGTVTIKQYCSFDSEPGDLFVANVSVGRGCVNDIVQSLSATMKFTLVEVLEPP